MKNVFTALLGLVAIVAIFTMSSQGDSFSESDWEMRGAGDYCVDGTDCDDLGMFCAVVPNLPPTGQNCNPANAGQLCDNGNGQANGHCLSLIHISEPTRPY